MKYYWKEVSYYPPAYVLQSDCGTVHKQFDSYEKLYYHCKHNGIDAKQV